MFLIITFKAEDDGRVPIDQKQLTMMYCWAGFEEKQFIGLCHEFENMFGRRKGSEKYQVDGHLFGL